ncbi:hypothetical protein TNCV_3310221 [Trichonephila clavipes]|nr:hypothetical protein TNCV_3310221 [Trichonephila clavipes]
MHPDFDRHSLTHSHLRLSRISIQALNWTPREILMTHHDIPIFYGYNAPSRRGNVSPFARVRPQRWGKKDVFHRIPFLVNRANVKTAIIILGTGDLPSLRRCGQKTNSQSIIVLSRTLDSTGITDEPQPSWP